MLARESGVDPSLHQLLAGAGDGVDAGIQRLGAPASDASAFSRMRAFSTWRTGLLPFWTAGCFAVAALPEATIQTLAVE